MFGNISPSFSLRLLRKTPRGLLTGTVQHWVWGHLHHDSKQRCSSPSWALLTWTPSWTIWHQRQFPIIHIFPAFVRDVSCIAALHLSGEIKSAHVIRHDHAGFIISMSLTSIPEESVGQNMKRTILSSGYLTQHSWWEEHDNPALASANEFTEASFRLRADYFTPDFTKPRKAGIPGRKSVMRQAIIEQRCSELNVSSEKAA